MALDVTQRQFTQTSDLRLIDAFPKQPPSAPYAQVSATSHRVARRRRWLVMVAAAASLSMIPWTFVLALTLPDEYVAPHWSATWVGFDAALVLSFATVAWATWRRSPAVRPATVVCATLLGCDVWFDLSTAATPGDLAGSAITAAFALPLAAVLLFLAPRARPDANQPGADRSDVY